MKNLGLLTEKLKQGKMAYFDEFYDATKNGVYFTIKSIVKDYSLAEDIMQGVYESFMNHINDIDTDKSIYSYLITTAKNMSLNEIKKGERLAPLDYYENIECPEEESFTPLLDFAKKNLDEYEWKILKLTVIDGYRRVEVAKLLNKPIATVNWQYNKILKKVEKMYKEVYDE